MQEFASPMLRRWELGSALRQLREDRGMTIADVTAAMRQRYGSSFSAAKLSRMETAKRGVIPRDVHDLCLLYEIPADQREHLVELAKSARSADSAFGNEHTRGYRWFAALEAVASGIREYSSMFMPGLLQTAAYAHAVENLSSVAPDYYKSRLEAEEFSEIAEDRVRMRLNRQRVLDREEPVKLHVVIDENVLRRSMPEPQIMREQLEHLVRMSKRPNIVVQMIPFTVGLYPGAESSYWSILDFPVSENRPPRTVYAEAAFGLRILDREPDVAPITHTFDKLTQLALSPEESREFVQDLLYTMS